ncbi:MAG TPA: anaerobic sulfatase-maturation protein [Candidatus Sulfotelmatobacter sp.]|nr:anaerobic sulfatase-maturation protein [Candidatus Sulfotelmatobacter sp.]
MPDILIPEQESDRKAKPDSAAGYSLKAFHVMAKPTGPICNLDCKYCFYLEKEKLYPGKSTGQSSWAMADDVLENYIRQYIEGQQVPVVNFAWQGGEPTLLGVEFFRKAVTLQKRHAGGKQITNAFQTNGVLLDDEWGAFFAENQFLVGISIDGPRELHDRYRVSKGGQPTFDRVMRGIECLKKHRVEFNTLTTVHRHNADHPLEIYRFLKEIGSGFMQFIPIVERVANAPGRDGLFLVAPGAEEAATVSPWSVEPLQYGKFLCAIFDEWVRGDVGRYFIQTFDVALESWVGVPQSLCVFRETCGAATVMEHNGDVYSCDHFVYPEYRLGNLMSEPLSALVNLPRQQKFGQDKRDKLPRQCRECEMLFACNGECPKHRFMRTPEGEPGLNYLCASYKLFFGHIDPYMCFMTDELAHARPPANVMQWALRRDAARVEPGKMHNS